MNPDILLSEIKLKAVRSSGPGGQNVNKVATKVVLSFDIKDSVGLDENEKCLILEKLSNKISSDNFLILSTSETRSQAKNKELLLQKFLELLSNALKVPKTRKVTKVPTSVIEKRLKNKKRISEIKQSRRKPDL
ncbi:MAG: alternative ribosome rescue aminoacyl-tRNA hydrolase ArfB [Flavobacteriaceae bacterium]|jgi:ribosome-associated protein|nr:alternative ribosome rescue aminoacyl-tRNA hydrolase ArfB [Flavobacteriaceae bacterium]